MTERKLMAFNWRNLEKRAVSKVKCFEMAYMKEMNDDDEGVHI